MRPSRLLIVVGCLTALHLPLRALADAASEGRLRDALRSAMARASALEDEKAQWSASQARLQQEVEALRAQVAKAGKCPETGRATAATAHRLAEQAELSAKLKASLEQCQAGGRDTDEQVRAGEAERRQLGTELIDLRQQLSRAEARTARILTVAKSIIGWIEKVGVADALAAREPFLGYKRVELENAAQDMKEWLADQAAVR
jgi:chromosome segregation ATPase